MSSPLRGQVKKLARRALVAKPRSGRSRSLTCQGGVPLGLPGEDWPKLKRTPLFPVLCVDIRELPFTPEFLRGSAYLALFIVPDDYEHSAKDGSLVVRRYPRIDALTPLPSPPGMALERLALQFREVEDLPMPDVLARVLGQPDLDRTELARIGKCHAGIKLGGYPHFFHTAFLREAEPDYQIQLDGTELYSYADAGIGFVCHDLTSAIWESM